jgi:hypothetical protein
MDRYQDGRRSPELAGRKTAVGSLVLYPLGLPFADVSKDHHLDPTRERGGHFSFPRLRHLEEVEFGSGADRSILSVGDLNDSLRTGDRVLYVSASRNTGHTCASQLLGFSPRLLDSDLDLGVGSFSVAGGCKGQLLAAF